MTHGAASRAANVSDVFPEPDVVPVCLVRSLKEFDDAVYPFWNKTGWARFTKKVVLSEEDCADAELGTLLFAEWVEGNLSCRLLPSPTAPGKLVLVQSWETSSRTLADEQTHIVDAWRETINVTGHKVASGKILTYNIYLLANEFGDVRRAFDAFAGFGGESV